MLRHIGLPGSALSGDLDRLYAERLLQLVRESSLEAAVILAHDQVYDSQGRVIEGVGSFYVQTVTCCKFGARASGVFARGSIHRAA